MPPASQPPSMVNTLPVMNDALSLARKATRLATSSLRPGRRSGKRLSMSSSSPVFRMRSLLATYPGQMVLTRIPIGPSSRASDLTKPITPCFDAEYADDIRTPVIPAADDHNRATAHVAHRPTRRLQTEQYTAQVHRHRAVPLLQRVLQNTGPVPRSSVEMCDMYGAATGNGLADHRIVVLRRCHVDPQPERLATSSRDLLGRPLNTFEVTSGAAHPGSRAASVAAVAAPIPGPARSRPPPSRPAKPFLAPSQSSFASFPDPRSSPLVFSEE